MTFYLIPMSLRWANIEASIKKDFDCMSVKWTLPLNKSIFFYCMHIFRTQSNQQIRFNPKVSCHSYNSNIQCHPTAWRREYMLFRGTRDDILSNTRNFRNPLNYYRKFYAYFSFAHPIFLFLHSYLPRQISNMPFVTSNKYWFLCILIKC